jgi:cytochrome c oxidase subunit 2
MITQFSFTPTVTTEEMRLNPDVVDKVKRTNAIRAKRAAEGIPNSDPWEFDYVLLCNKICGKSHYNMQMKIIVETEEEYNKWIAEQKTFKESVMVDETEQAFNTEDGVDIELEDTTSEE